MPADHLTIPSADLVASAVRAVIAGRDLQDAAAGAAVDIADLEDAIGTYHAAGTAALEQRANSRWQHVSIGFADPESSEQTGANVIGPLLDGLQADGAVACWWFLRKPPGWRIRMLDASPSAVGAALARLSEGGVIGRLATGVLRARGLRVRRPGRDGHRARPFLRRQPGRAGLPPERRAAARPSRAVDPAHQRDAQHRRSGLVRTRRRLRPCCRHAPRSASRPAGTGRAARLAAADAAGRPPQAAAVAFTPGSQAGFAADWHAAFAQAGRQFGDAARRGQLTRGLRAVLAQTVIFHWNRLGFTAMTQGILASAAAQACLPRE